MRIGDVIFSVLCDASSSYFSCLQSFPAHLSRSPQSFVVLLHKTSFQTPFDESLHGLKNFRSLRLRESENYVSLLTFPLEVVDFRSYPSILFKNKLKGSSFRYSQHIVNFRYYSLYYINKVRQFTNEYRSEYEIIKAVWIYNRVIYVFFLLRWERRF